MLLDPALPLEEGNAHVGTLILGYVRTIDFFGMAGKVGSLFGRHRHLGSDDRRE